MVGVEYDAVMGAVWLDDAGGSSLTAIFVGVAAELMHREQPDAEAPAPGGESESDTEGSRDVAERLAQTVRVAASCLDAGRYGLAGVDSAACAAGARVAVASVNVTSGAEAAVGTFPACCVDLDLDLAARSVAALRLRLLTTANETSSGTH